MADYAGMSLRKELETRFADAERREQEEEFLSRGWQPPAEREELPGFQRKQIKNSDKSSLSGISDQVSGAVEDMINNYVNMREDNTIGNDDYFHDTGINHKGRQLARKKIYSSSKDACDIYRVKGINDRY